MPGGIVFVNNIKAGYLAQGVAGGYVFEYTDEYYAAQGMPPISLTLPKTQQRYESEFLFPFFSGLLSEGINKDIQCRLLKIDEHDDFTRLLKTAGTDTIGAITIREETTKDK